ncbi:MAG: DUF2933 domain-containing protein [Alphaproteobacteria bacterium]|jgi:hypothetical protein|nr:DUF2933 domain-containing protein [Alphaproteobacteria bacterium]
MASNQPSGRMLKFLTLAAFGAGLTYLLIGEHRVHLLGWLPFLLLLLCPLLHMTMHGGHGRGHRQGPPGPSAADSSHPHQS